MTEFELECHSYKILVVRLPRGKQSQSMPAVRSTYIHPGYSCQRQGHTGGPLFRQQKRTITPWVVLLRALSVLFTFILLVSIPCLLVIRSECDEQLILCLLNMTTDD